MLCSMWQGATAALVIVFGVCVGIIHGTSYEKRPFEHDGLVEVASKRRALDVGPGYEAATMDAGAHYVANDTVGIAKKVAHNDGSMQQNQRYKILSKIGAGTYGKVFVAKDMTSRHNHIVAVKMQDISNSTLRRKVALNEVRLLRSLQGCPSIVQMIGAVSAGNRVTIVMEYLSRGTLADRIRSQGRISENDSRQYLDDIICGVDACHKLNIIVNDMKPENMAFDEEDNLKLIDFGMAVCSPSRRMQRSGCTPSYASPEQFKLEGNQITHREFDGVAADIWTLGVILIEMLTGKRLYQGSHCDDVRRNVANNRANQQCMTISRQMSLGARLLISRILLRDPCMRPTISEIARDDWFQEDSSSGSDKE